MRLVCIYKWLEDASLNLYGPCLFQDKFIHICKHIRKYIWLYIPKVICDYILMNKYISKHISKYISRNISMFIPENIFNYIPKDIS